MFCIGNCACLVVSIDMLPMQDVGVIALWSSRCVTRLQIIFDGMVRMRGTIPRCNMFGNGICRVISLMYTDFAGSE